MERTLIKNLNEHVGETITINAWVDVARDQGKMAFFDFRDRTGKVQGVVFGKPEVLEVAKTLRGEYVVAVAGIVNKRPEKMVNANVVNGDIEIEITGIEILSKAHELPFEVNGDLNLDTILDNRPFTLKSDRSQGIFKVAATILQSYRQSLIDQDFLEFQAPALVGSDAEGGAEVFKVEYFNGKTVNLATSPQFYKEIMTGAFERVFTIAKIFRAEKSATTRHLSEVTQMDFEMSFIKDHNQVMDVLEIVARDVSNAVKEKHAAVLAQFNTTPALLPDGPFPRFTLLEAQQIIEREFGGKAVGELDMEPEHERQICEWTKKEHGSDFVFITDFPTKKRAFYSLEIPETPELCRSFDLLFRGLEINSGAQRYHDYDAMVEKIKSRGMDPSKFGFYLQMHKYGVAPHGGSSTGLERFTARMLEIPNVKEAVPFPRDINRIDTLLSDGAD
jgi:nondiscriminating aspartyl-tRNA synthetase